MPGTKSFLSTAIPLRALRHSSMPAVLAAGLLLASPLAQAQIYKCEGPDGVVEYSNTPQPASNRSCKAVALPNITTIPTPKLPAKAVAPGGAAGAAGSAVGDAPGGASASRAAASPAGFPKVEPATQRTRDDDRRRILEDELRREETKLAELKKEYNSGEPERVGGERNYQKYLDRVERLKEDIARAEANIGAIRRELASIKE